MSMKSPLVMNADDRKTYGEILQSIHLISQLGVTSDKAVPVSIFLVNLSPKCMSMSVNGELGVHIDLPSFRMEILKDGISLEDIKGVFNQLTQQLGVKQPIQTVGLITAVAGTQLPPVEPDNSMDDLVEVGKEKHNGHDHGLTGAAAH